jgi:hypothetical protein
MKCYLKLRKRNMKTNRFLMVMILIIIFKIILIIGLLTIKTLLKALKKIIIKNPIKYNSSLIILMNHSLRRAFRKMKL